MRALCELERPDSPVGRPPYGLRVAPPLEHHEPLADDERFIFAVATRRATWAELRALARWFNRRRWL
jgi:hypothetical protein